MEELNLYDPGTYAEGFPHEYFQKARAENPIFHREDHPFWEGGNYWNLTRREDVYEVSRNWELYSSSPHPFFESEEEQEGNPTSLLLISLDPPDHTKMRLLVNKGFTPRRVKDLEIKIQNTVKRLIDDVADKGSCDMVSDIAVELPLQVIADLVGIPSEDRHKIFEWTELSFGFDQSYTPEQRQEAIINMYVYAEQMCVSRQKDPQDDLISVLCHAEVDEHSLTQEQINTFFLLLQNAGSETTRNLITSGTMALLNNPDQLELLRKNPDLMPKAIDEMLRYTTPVMQFKRTANEDTQIGDFPVKKGERVVMWYSSANRDENEFDKPDELDITRDPNPHVAFGAGGPHFCLGASLARMESEIMFDAIVNRFVDLEADEPDSQPRVYSNLIDGLAKMPIRWSDVKD